MSIRNWVFEQLRKEYQMSHKTWSIEEIGNHGVRVLRPKQTDAIAYCAEPDRVYPFTAADLNDALTEIPLTGMVVVTRRVVDPEVYNQARETKVCVDTFGGLTRALANFEDISNYVHPEETYLRKRLAATRVVTSVTRKGHRAWALERKGDLRTITIVSHDRYELTDEGFTEVLNQYPDIHVDALVVTNPSAQGFGKRVTRTAAQAEIPLRTLDDFLNEIREPWE